MTSKSQTGVCLFRARATRESRKGACPRKWPLRGLRRARVSVPVWGRQGHRPCGDNASASCKHTRPAQRRSRAHSHACAHTSTHMHTHRHTLHTHRGRDEQEAAGDRAAALSPALRPAREPGTVSRALSMTPRAPRGPATAWAPSLGTPERLGQLAQAAVVDARLRALPITSFYLVTPLEAPSPTDDASRGTGPPRSPRGVWEDPTRPVS